MTYIHSTNIRVYTISEFFSVCNMNEKKQSSLCTWHNPTENCPNSGICRRISSVTKWTPRCWGLKLILRWNQAEPICMPLLVPRWLELDAIAAACRVFSSRLRNSKYSNFASCGKKKLQCEKSVLDDRKEGNFLLPFSLTLFTRSFSLTHSLALSLFLRKLFAFLFSQKVV